MKRKKLLAGVLAFLIGLSAGSGPALAASGREAQIDPVRTGSLTLYKYDGTAAENAGVTGVFRSDGEADPEAESVYAGYGIQGVTFMYLQVGTIETSQSIDPVTGEVQMELVYGLDAKSVQALTDIGLNETEAVSVKDEISYYHSDTLADTLAGALEKDRTKTKNSMETWIRQHGGTALPETDVNGRTFTEGLPLGLYLVAETTVPEDVISTVDPFFVSLPMTDPEGEAWMYDVTVYPKNQTGGPDLSKEVAEVTSEESLDYQDTATASGGDALAYRITSTLPEITSQATYLTEYTFVDTLSQGISYQKGDVVMNWQASDGQALERWTEKDKEKKFTVSYQKGENGDEIMTIALTQAGLAAVNPDHSLDTVTIEYGALVRSDEALVCGDQGNPNQVELTWKRTSMEYYDTLTDDCLVYTYGLALTKVFQGKEGDYSQVGFRIRNVSDDYYVTARQVQDGVYYVTGTAGAAEAEATVFCPGAEGKLDIHGMEDDCYLITEIRTDAGYALLKEEIELVLVSEERVHKRNGSAAVNQKEVGMVEEAGSAHAMAPLTVVNTKVIEVPMTGDRGEFLLPILGCLTGAALFLAAYRKKRERYQ